MTRCAARPEPPWGELAYECVTRPTERRGHILHPFAIACMQGILALNVTRGSTKY